MINVEEHAEFDLARGTLIKIPLTSASSANHVTDSTAIPDPGEADGVPVLGWSSGS